MSTQLLGIAAGVFTGISLLPQLIKMIKEKTPQDISLVMLFSLFIGLILWVIYGVRKDDAPIIVTNAFSLAVNCCILFCNYHYRRREQARKKTAPVSFK